MSREPLLRRTLPLIALIMAANYFSFRTELIRCEMEENETVTDILVEGGTLSEPSLNWETFDKDNATKAFVCAPVLPVQLLYVVAPVRYAKHPLYSSFRLVRDKSPPSGSPSVV